MIHPHYRAAIFDLDGVIADTARFHFVAWQRLAKEEGFAIPHVVDDRVKGVDRMASLNIVLEYTDRGYSQAEKDALAARKNGYYVELIKALTPADLLPGAGEVLHTLRAAKVPVGLASASKNAVPVLQALGVLDDFDYIVDAATVTNGKPDPEIFLKAAHALGVDPSLCVGFEDAPAGVSSILSAGMFAVGIGEKDLLADAHEVFPSLADVSLARYFQL